MPAPRLLVVLALLSIGVARSGAVPCPDAGAITIVADNRSAHGTVTLAVSGTRVAGAGGCTVAGPGLASSYATTMTCTGSGAQRCGRIGGLAPGLWVHRVSVQVSGSALQRQAQRGMVLARGGSGVSNAVEWTVFARTVVVAEPTDDVLLGALDAAQQFTAATPAPARALVRFDPAAFPGAVAPTTIDLRFTVMQPGDVHVCQPDAICNDGRKTTYCLEGSRVTVDALDDDGLPGGVVLDAGTCSRSLLRVYGSEDVLRGLVLRGSANPTPTIPLDTVAISGASAVRNRLEQCTIVGPTMGDGLSVEHDAGRPDGSPDPENVVLAGEVRGAEDKGVKVDFGGVARIERTCLHDNANGGIQATLGGTVTAIENVVQHNVGGGAQNGLLVGVPMSVGAPNALTTRGNVVRFNGARGVSVVNATAVLESDVVSDNYEAGLRIETTLPAVAPTATVRGGTYACNFAPGLCSGGGGSCRIDGDCASASCPASAGSPFAVPGIGVALVSCPDPGCAPPLVDLGTTADGGRNAVTSNANPGATILPGINLRSAIVGVGEITARGNQWEHCDVPQPNPGDASRCNAGQVEAYDVDVVPGTAPLDLGFPPSPRSGPAPTVTAISPARPKAGDLVRLYGGPFDAVDGAACAPPGVPPDACAGGNADVAARNAAGPEGHAVAITLGGETLAAPVQQVTPSMLVVAMPVDCFAAGTVVVARGPDVGPAATLCDPGGCDGRPDGAVCEDDDVCTTGESCRAGSCVPSGTLACDDGNACTDDACDAAAGCVHPERPALDGVRCHVVQLRALVGALPSEQARLARKLGARIDCVDARLTRAAALPDGSRRRVKQARRALRCSARYLHQVEHARALLATTRSTLTGEGHETYDAIARFFDLA